MGFFAVYCGLVYNEWFAINTSIFESCYNPDRVQWGKAEGRDGGQWVYTRKSFDCTVAFGQDSIWGSAQNKLNVANGVKMKLSVIMGILHMSIGIIIKGTNSIHFGRYDELFAEVIGGLIILLFLFGWMDLLIVAKWFHSVDIEDTTLVDNPIAGQPQLFKGDLDNQRTPGIINILIVSVFSQGNYQGTSAENNDPIFGSTLDEQYGVAVILLLIAILLMPVMLLFKPLFFLCTHKGGANVHEEVELIEGQANANE